MSVTVEEGDTASAIGQTLFEKKVVKSVKAYVNAATANPKGNTVQPGTYKLFEQMPASAALAMLLDPEKNMVTNRITIPEGKTSFDIVCAILSEKTGIPVAEFQAAAKDPIKNLGIPDWWYKRGDGKPADVSVEGFLFPDTYSFQPEDTATDILKTMVNHFLSVAGDLKFADTVQAGLGGITPYEALIVASLARWRRARTADMPQVARVALQPGRRGPGQLRMSAVRCDRRNYWLQKQGKPTKASKDMTEQELNDPANPYNTGLSSKGLPLGPISNPGKAALQGAMAPPAGKWIFFVATDKNGTTKFSETQAQFDRDLAEACRNKVTC